MWTRLFPLLFLFVIPTPGSDVSLPISAELRAGITQLHALIDGDDASSAALHESLGFAYMHAGDIAKAIAYLKTAHELAGAATPPRVLINLANALKGEGEFDAALHYYNVLIKLHPSMVVGYVLAGITLEAQGRLEESAASFDKASGLEPSDRMVTWVTVYRLSVLLKLGQLGRAYDIWHALIGRANHPHPLSSWLVWDTLSGASFTATGAVGIHDSEESMVAYTTLQQGVDAYSSLRFSRRQILSEDYDVQTLQESLWSHQGQRHCASARVLVMQLQPRTEGTGFGFGAQMHVLSIALSYAYSTGRVLVLRSVDKWWYTSAHDCPSQSFSCYFERPSYCSDVDVGLAAQDAGAKWLTEETQHARVVVADSALDGFLTSRANREHVPPRFRYRGLLWWRSQLLVFLMQPKKWVAMHIAQVKETVAWHGASIGLHMRCGDKKSESGVFTVADYMNATVVLAKAVRKATHNNTVGVYVSTDDAHVLRQTERWIDGFNRAGHSDLTLSMHYQRTELRDVVSATESLTKTHAVNMTRYALDAITNVFLLSQTRVFVGTFSSNFGRLVYELMLGAATPSRPLLWPAVSLDVPWHAYP